MIVQLQALLDAGHSPDSIFEAYAQQAKTQLKGHMDAVYAANFAAIAQAENTSRDHLHELIAEQRAQVAEARRSVESLQDKLRLGQVDRQTAAALLVQLQAQLALLQGKMAKTQAEHPLEGVLSELSKGVASGRK